MRSPTPPHLQSLQTADLELLHAGLVDNQFLGSITIESLRIGHEFSYVLHILLSLSALRLFDRQPSRMDLLVQANQHQTFALRLVRPHLSALDRSNIDPVLNFSHIVSIAALAHPLYSQCKEGALLSADVIGDMIQSFHITRGIKLISQRKWELNGYPRSNCVPDMEDEDPWNQGLLVKYPGYSTIREVITRCCNTGLERSSCLDAIRKVFSFIDLIEDWPDLHHDARLIQIWPIELHQHFMAMLSDRHPVALCVLGNYAALLKLRSGTTWPFATWPVLLLQAVEADLGVEWHSVLHWARRRVLSLSTRITKST